ncbi:MAG TPA: hypothetical protein PKM65_12615 [Spirochaetota bacterium]|nr:hypothetical protein [Spirochaetota bacterium]HNT10318.1 hypothetical protein [Spirochaetota bacterium]
MSTKASTVSVVLIVWLVAFIPSLLQSSRLQAQSKNDGKGAHFTWDTINGDWEIKKTTAGKSYLYQSRIRAIPTGYSELINYNSIITVKPVERHTRIGFTLYLTKPGGKPVEALLVFAAKDFRNLHAFKFTGDSKRLTKIALISSKVNKPELPKSVKWNYTITELATSAHRLNFNTEYQIAIETAGGRATLYVNGSRIMQHDTGADLQSGMVGFCCQNTQMAIGEFSASDGTAIMLHDDFTTESIKRHRVIATPVEK